MLFRFVINQLMLQERQPQIRLVAKTAAIGSMSAAYKGLNTRFDAILQAATSLGKNTDWQAMKATTGDSTRLTASASPTALAGNLTVSVERLASTHTLVSELAVPGLAAVVASGDLTSPDPPGTPP